MTANSRQNQKHGKKESCGNAGAVESVESQKQASPSFHSPLEISPRTGEIPTFPQLRRRGGWKSGKPKAGFPLSHRPDSLSFKPKNTTAGGLSPPARAALRAASPATSIIR